MKIDRNKLKKSTTEVPADCKSLIEKLRNVAEERLLDELKAVKSWTFGKCELYHWSDILDRFDEVLDKACKKESDRKWMLSCDIPDNGNLKELLLQVLQFTSLLIEHSFSRHLYNSMEHLTTLLSSCDMTIVLAVLNLLYVFSKRSNFITRLGNDKKQGLIIRLTHLAESWGGKDNGFGLAECCKDSPITSFPSSATTLHFEFYTENKEEKGSKKANVITSIHMEHLDKSEKLPSEIMEELMDSFKIPEEKQTLLYTHIRLAYLFSRYEARVQCVHARLQALAILVYSNAIQDNMNVLLYPGLIEELVDIVELKDDNLVEIKSASLRTLTSIIHLERNPKLNNIIDATGASSYHGFLPVLVRSCIQHMTDSHLKPFPQQYATALFSFLYHLASYENGVEALVSCGMMECLLKVINWYGDGQEHITQFVTRAVRVVDLITNLDMAAFQSQGGLSTFINRLEHEVEICRKEQPFEIHVRSNRDSIIETSIRSPQPSMETDAADKPGSSDMNNSDETCSQTKPETSASDEGTSVDGPVFDGPSVYEPQVSPKTGVQCFAQRAALLKSMLNFLKKAIPDPAFSESIRHLMEGSLPKSLRHIISNAEYYGPSLFLLATDVVTVYVFQEPSLLSSLQDSGLTDVVLHALLIKDVPATREVLASLPNVFSALCLNTRGLESFVSCKPFDRLFKVLLSPDYLPAMRRRRSSDPFGDTASNLGNAMDELMRHQPSLRTDATKAIIKLLEEVSSMGMDPHYICQKPQPKVELMTALSAQSPQPPDNGSSDEEDEDEDIPNTQDSSLTPKPSQSAESAENKASSSQSTAEKQAIPLLDYVLNVMKFVEAILSNNSTDDHCREFVAQKGLQPLMGILGLPNLPIDFPTSPACQAVSIVCKAILTLSREPQVLKQGLLKLEDVLQNLESLHKPLESPGGSVLLRELANASHLADPTASPQSTPLLHALSSCHAYIMMFVHVCRMGQTDIRTISVSHWGSDLGLKVLEGLSKLYTSLVWESTVLLALCSEDILPKGSDFGKVDMDKLLPKDFKAESESKEDEGSTGSLIRSTGEMGSNGVSAAMESLSTSEHHDTPMDVGESQNTTSEPSSSQSSIEKDKDGKKSKMSPTLQAQVKQLKPLLSVSSRLCRSLAELFGLLVKLCVGSPVRQRRSHQITPNPTTPSPAAQAVAKALTRLLTNGLQWEPPPYSPVPKLRLTFLVCSVGFTSPMLFDEKKHPYHLMLQKFQTSGGQAALFQAFSWALSINGKLPMTDGLESPELPDGTGEFLDAWLMLVEKMVNPKTVLESAHTLPTKSTQPGFVPFSPTQYLISTQKAAFKAVMNLWNKKPLKVYGSRMSESILAILCHIIKGESIIAEQFAKEKEEMGGEASASGTGPAAGSSVATAPPPAPARPSEPEINQSHLQQLMDMGFTREHCIQALTHTSNLEQATEYILTHPLVPQVRGLVMDMDLSEEDQMMRAIAMSLGENVVMSTDAAGQPQPQEKSSENEEKKPSQVKTAEMDEKQQKEEPLEKSVIDKFTDCVLPGCLTLLDTLPETVYRVCDLLIVVTQRNGSEWQKKILSALVKEIQTLGHQMLSVDQLVDSTPSDSSTDNKTHPVASKFATRLHLFSLLFEEAMMPCAETIEDVYLTDLLVQVLNSGQEFLTTNKDSVTHKWLAPLLLLLDLYEKVSVISKRKAEANKLLENSHTWKWFDDSSGRWCKYSLGNNKTIDDAYQAGETSVRFQAGRRRYTVYFSSMVQLNEETGNRRPIMLTLPTPEENQQIKEEPKQDNKVVTLSDTESNQNAENKMETTESEGDKKTKDTRIVQGLNSDQITSIIRSVVTLISIPVEPESLHAAMRLALRLTREHKYALLFAELNGPKLLLELTQGSAFQGFLSLATLIFRHILEEPASLRYCMERVVKKATSGSGSSMSGVHQGSLGSKEVHYVLRVLGPAACRNPSLFAEVTKNVLRIALPPPSKRDEDESRYTSPNAPQILKSLSTKQLAITTVESPIKEVLHDLLNGLIFKINYKDDGSEARTAQTLAEAISEVVNELNDRQSQLRRQNSAADFTQEDETAEGGTDQANKDSKDKDGKSAEELRKQRPLIPKSSILRLLSEMVKSYSSCTQLITQYAYQSGQTELVSEECTVLAFVLDHLLPQCQKDGDRDCPALSRVFLASIASCNHCPEAQLSLVNEIKGALQRALALPESSDKHTRIQALTNIISIIIESCPSPGQVPNQVFKGQQNVMNNIVKSLLKKGLVSDLARIPHSLDLSSPYMASTINSALKPLETLSRSVNQPIQSVTAKPKSKTDTDNADTIEEGGTTFVPLIPEEDTSEVIPTTTSHQVEEITIEDISDQVDHQDAYEESQAQMDRTSGLEEVLDQLLDTGSGDPESQVLGEMVMDTDTTGRVTHNDDSQDEDLIDVEEDQVDLDHHDSQMMSQDISIDIDDGDVNTHDVHGTESSDTSSDADEDDDNDDGENDDEDDDGDDEEDEDDEGSDMEAENEDFYHDFEPTSMNHHQYYDDNIFQMENMFPLGDQHILFNALDNSQHVRSYGFQLPGSLHDNDNGNEASVPSVPPAPSNVTATHPLLMRQPDAQGMVGVARVHRAGGSRQRSTCRYNPSTQTLHVNFPRQPNPPVILQRLLGPTTAADVLQLTSTLTSVAGPTHTRVVLGNDDLRIISRPDDDLFDELFQDSYPESYSSGSGVLKYIPSTLTRWTEEAKVLDGDSVHDCVTALKPDIIEELEKFRDEELAERRDKRKKASDEKEMTEDKNGTANNDTPKLGCSTTAETLSLNNAMTTTTTTTALTTSVTTSVTTTSSQESSARQISASEAARAAELIATAMVEGILSTPQTSGTSSSSERSIISDNILAAGGQPHIAETFMTPAQTHPIITPSAPRIERPRSSTPSNISNLASLLLSEDDSATVGRGTPLMSFRQPLDPLPPLPVGSIDSPLGTQQPTEGSITPEEVSGISSSDAVTVQSSGSSEELNTTGIIAQESRPDSTRSLINTITGTAPVSMGTDRVISGITGIDSTVDFSPLLPLMNVNNVPPGGPPLDIPPLINPVPMSMGMPPLDTTMTVSQSQFPTGEPLINMAGLGITPPATTMSAAAAMAAGAMVPESAVQPAGNTGETGGSSLPDGVDPSFLAALPDNIRQEVIAEQMRLNRIQQNAREQAQNAQNTGSMEVNPEFLAALPPSIQEEVLAQQRSEQARLQAQTTPAAPNPDEPIDHASFFATMPSSLRQQVLADMDDSMVAVLPADLAAEAQTLRRDLEERHRRLMQERLFAQAGAGSLSAILRHSGFAGTRLGSGRYPPMRVVARGSGNQWAWRSGRLGGQSSTANTSAMKLRGRHLLDHEALTCLLVLLFLDEPKLNTNRLHRVLRNLCYHAPTRIWVLKALLSILSKTGDMKLDDEKMLALTPSIEKSKKKKTPSVTSTQQQQQQPSSSVTLKSDTKSQGSWLSISLEAALGCRANVFQIQKSGKKHTVNSSPGTVTVHPQAAPMVCRHVLDTLIALAKVFPSQFLPATKAKEVTKCETTTDNNKKEDDKLKSSVATGASSKVQKPSSDGKVEGKSETDFWDLLVKLDSVCGKKGKGFQRTHSSMNVDNEVNFNNFDTSPLGQLMLMLSHPVVKRSQLLTDRLLRLLQLVSIGLPDVTQGSRTTTALTTASSNIIITPAVTTTAVTTSSVSTVNSATTTTTPVVSLAEAATGTTTSGATPNSGTAANATTPTANNEQVTKKDTQAQPSSEEEKKIEEKDEPAILEDQLQLAVQVLTSKSCSEEGLEDATNLLVQLSWANNATRSSILKLLLEGARELGLTVCSHIKSLLQELQMVKGKVLEDLDEEMKDSDSLSANPAKGLLTDRFAPNHSIVVAAPKKIKGGRELQLPSMTLLTSKTSSQQFFLRILKVIIQLRDAARTAVKKTSTRRPDSRDISNIEEAMAAIEAEAESLMEMVGRNAQQAQQLHQHVQYLSQAYQNTPATSTSGTPAITGSGEQNNSGAASSQFADESSQQNDSNAQGASAVTQSTASSIETSGGSESVDQRNSMSDSARESGAETPMDIDQPGTSQNEQKSEEVSSQAALPRLSEQLLLEDLWQMLGECLTELAKTPDHHAVLILQPAVEAFFLVHAGEKEGKSQELPSQKREDQLAHLNIDVAPSSPAPSSSEMPTLVREISVASVSSISNLPPDTQKFLKFAEMHRTVLNQILRQTTTHLADGPFSVLVDHTRILDFDVKRRYFRQELERLDEGMRREDLAVHVRRENVFEDSYRELFRRSADEWKHRFYIVFEGEEGQDAGGLLREWYIIISREIFNPMYALFEMSAGDRVTYTINPSSHCNSNHLSYFKFVGRIIAKAIYDNKLLECYFTRSFYKHILGQLVKYMDMESEDYSFYQGLVFLLENDVEDLGYELTFSTEIREFGVTEIRDLKPNGRNIPVTEHTKKEYVKLVCQMKMTGAIRQQLNAFMDGFYDIIPKKLISIFNEQELELLISGLPNIDIDDLKANSEYHKYQPTSLQVQWFWRALRSFDQEERAKFLQFVTGTSKVPLQGFAYLEGMNGYQKFQIHRDDRSTDRLPVAHTCFNQLDLPAYETYDKLRHMLLLACNECSEGFGLA